MSPEEIREALAAPINTAVIFEAARAYADLLENGFERVAFDCKAGPLWEVDVPAPGRYLVMRLEDK